jgi:cbb3-type cytochrome oxidase subunit 3
MRKEEKMNPLKKQNEVRTSIKLFLLFILLVVVGFVAYESAAKRNQLDVENQAVGVVILNDDTVMPKVFEPSTAEVVTQELKISIRPRLASGAKTSDQ